MTVWQGQIVGAPVTPGSDAVVFPTHYDILGAGGHMGTLDTTGRNAIPVAGFLHEDGNGSGRRRHLMLVTVADDGGGKVQMYRLIIVGYAGLTDNQKLTALADNANWVPINDGFSVTTANFTVPASLANVSVQMDTTAWMSPGQVLFIQNAGYFQLVSVDSAFSVTVQNLGYTGNASPGTVISLGAKVAPGGLSPGDADLSGRIPFVSNNYISVFADGTALENGTKLLAAVAAAKALTPNESVLGYYNRAVVLLLPGVYDLGYNFITLGGVSPFVDIVGLGDREDIVITSSNSVGTIHIDDDNDYILKNLSIFNQGISGSSMTEGGSIVHNASATDTGRWYNLILGSYTTENTNFAGTYSYITGLVTDILNGTIDVSATVSNCNFADNSCGYSATAAVTIGGIIKNCVGGNQCFGFSNNSNVTIGGSITNCTGGDFCFGYSNSGSITFNSNGYLSGCRSGSWSFIVSGGSTIIINGKIINCNTTNDHCFGYASLNATLGVNALIENCMSNSNSFLSSDTGDVIINGKILKSTGILSCFGYSNDGDVLIADTSFIKDCIAGNKSYGWSNTGTVTISGEIIHDLGGSQCFGFAFLSGGVTIDGLIKDCLAIDNSYGSCGTGSGVVSISGKIINCVGNSQCFARSTSGTTTMSGYIINCQAADGSFGATTSTTCTISGTIKDCIATDALCFGYSSSGDVVISGSIINCNGTSQSFGHSTSGSITTSGLIKSCSGTTTCFGDTTSTGKIVDCTRTAGYGTHSGTIDRCTFSENHATNPTLTIASGAKVKYSTIYQAGAADTIYAAAPITAAYYQSTLNKIPNTNITNSIDIPYNVVDGDIVI